MQFNSWTILTLPRPTWFLAELLTSLKKKQKKALKHIFRHYFSMFGILKRWMEYANNEFSMDQKLTWYTVKRILRRKDEKERGAKDLGLKWAAIWMWSVRLVRTSCKEYVQFQCPASWQFVVAIWKVYYKKLFHDFIGRICKCKEKEMKE